MNFAVMAKFIHVALRLPWTFQFPNGFKKRAPTSFPITFPLSRPCREPPSNALRSCPELRALSLPCDNISQAQKSESRACAITALRPIATEPSAAHCLCRRALSLLPRLVPPCPSAPESTAVALPSALHFTYSAPAARLDHSHGLHPWRPSLQAQGQVQYL